MDVKVRVPELPDGIDEAIVGSWLKNVRDRVYTDENLVDLETDKVVLEVPSLIDGIITRIQAQTGDTVVPSQILAFVNDEDIHSKGFEESHQFKNEAALENPQPSKPEWSADFDVPAKTLPQKAVGSSLADSILGALSTALVLLAFAVRYLGGIFVFGLFIYGLFVLFAQSISLGLMIIGASMVITFLINVVSWFLLAIAGAS